MRRLPILGAGIAAAGLLVGCAPVDPAPTSTTSTPPTTSPDELNACLIERRTIRTALEAYKASVPPQAYPGSIDELVGWFLKNPPQFEWLYTSDGATYSLEGQC